ncbi:C40 family peptidase [Sphingomonas quercus]|uniref:C40 family peptidase n=1 Tax=Sphingomonas quercus TaxID=2842451 RepID=UPI0034262F08
MRLTGPSRRIDPRIHAARGDIADVALADRVFAPHYALPLEHGCAAVSAPIRAEPSLEARAVSELLRGEGFAVVDVAGGWAWGYSLHDHYVGYVALDALGTPLAATHRVSAPAGYLFSAPDIKAPIVARLPMGVLLAGTSGDAFLDTAEGFVHMRHVRALDDDEADYTGVAERLIGAPYRWGGRSGDGLDCSGLVQTALAAAGIAAPRDSDQQAALGEEIAEGEALRRGDLIFFPGHVGIMADEATLLHANAFWMATVAEPLDDVVARLAPAYMQPVTARRRL